MSMQLLRRMDANGQLPFITHDAGEIDAILVLRTAGFVVAHIPEQHEGRYLAFGSVLSITPKGQDALSRLDPLAPSPLDDAARRSPEGRLLDTAQRAAQRVQPDEVWHATAERVTDGRVISVTFSWPMAPTLDDAAMHLVLTAQREVTQAPISIGFGHVARLRDFKYEILSVRKVAKSDARSY